MNKTIGVIAFVVAIIASFYSGFLYHVVDESNAENVDKRVLEVMEELENNHFSQPDRALLVRGAIDGMIAALNDPFTTYFSAEDQEEYEQSFEENYVGIGITVSYVNNLIVIEQVFHDGPADQAGLIPNDIIAFIDGEDIRDQSFYESIAGIAGEVGTIVEIGVIRQGIEDPIYFEVRRKVIDNPSVTFEIIEEGTKQIGYINVSTFGSGTAALFQEAITELEVQNIDGLIIDLRDNGGGLLSAVYAMLDEFLIDDGRPIFTTEFYDQGEYKRREYHAENTVRKPYEIITLINENSASASEVFASSMQEHGGYPIYGVDSFGKGTMQTDIQLEAMIGDSIHMTIGKWFTSDGGWVHYDGGLDGITPDVIVEQDSVMKAYKVFMITEEDILFDTVSTRLINIQIILTGMGYDIRTDGYFDVETRDALEQVQTNNGLKVTGDVNENTLAVLNDFLTEYKNNILNDVQLMEAVDYFEQN